MTAETSKRTFTASVHELRAGDFVDLLDVAADVVSTGWLTSPWEGRQDDYERALRDLAVVTQVRHANMGAIVEFENFHAWYIPAHLSVEIHPPRK